MKRVVMSNLKYSRFSILWYFFSVLLSLVYTYVMYITSSIKLNDWVFLLQIPLYIAVIIVHEGLHIGWKVIFGYTGKITRVKNGKTSIITFLVDQPMKNVHFLLIVASPFVVLNAVYILFIHTPFASYMILPILLNNLGCHIDAQLVWKAVKTKPSHVTVANGVVTFDTKQN